VALATTRSPVVKATTAILRGTGANNIDGGGGNDSLAGGDDTVSDTIQGGDGNDTIDGGTLIDFLSGGNGNDVFQFTAGDSGFTAGAIDRVLDWQGGTSGAVLDTLDFATAGTVNNYIEAGTATDFTTALAAANAFFTANTSIDYYAVQLSDGVVVFSDNATNTTVDAVVLVGRTLADVAFDNIV
jgi:Ca2+-binding RTX toxin-like protein